MVLGLVDITSIDGIDIDDLMIKCRQVVVVASLKG